LFSEEEEKRSSLELLMGRLRGEESSDDALSLAVRHHIYYGGGSDSFMARYNRMADENPSDEPRLFGDLSTLSGEFELDENSLNQSIREVTAYSAFSSFDKDMQNVLGNGANALKRLHGRFYFGSKTQDATFASKNVYDTIYRPFSIDADKEGWTIAPESPLHGMREHVLQTIVDADVNSGRGNFVNIRSELNRMVRGNLSINKKNLALIDKNTDERIAGMIGQKTYVNRPGIAPFLSMIQGADTEIVIDTYQFQNKAISDYLYNWVTRKALAGETPRLTIRLAMPRDKGVDSATSYDILGPNLIQILKFKQLKEQLNNDFPDRDWDDLIKVEVESDVHHSKMYFTDRAAAIGSINLTSPVGYNPNQAGSNYEMMRIFHSVAPQASMGDLRSALTDLKIRHTLGLNKEQLREEFLYRQVKDLREQMENRVRGSSMNFTNRRGQLGMGGDIFEHLEKTVEMLDDPRFIGSRLGDIIAGGTKSDKSRARFANRSGRLELHMILDQVMLLQHADGLFNTMVEGEFGRFSDDQLSRMDSTGARRARYKRVQSKVLRALADNRAFIVADARNLREGVIDPLMFGAYDERTGTNRGPLIAREVWEQHDYDIAKLARKATGSSVDERVLSLSNQFGFSNETSLQVLALASGNIRAAGVPRQHVKAYSLMARLDDRKGAPNLVALSSYMGSSNLGLYSSPMRGIDDLGSSMDSDHLSHEIGLTMMMGQVRSMMDFNTTSEYALSSSQEYVEMQRYFLPNWSLAMSQLGVSAIENKNFMEVRSRSLWEGNVDSKSLVGLRDGIHNMMRSMKIDESVYSIGTVTDGSSQKVIGLELSLDARALAGFGKGFEGLHGESRRISYRFTTLKGAGADPMVYAIDQGKIIGRSLFVNNSDVELPILDRTIQSKSSTVLNSIDNTLAFIATLAAEVTHRALIDKPRKTFESLDGKAQRVAIGDYLARLAGIRGGQLEGLYNTDVLTDEHALKLAEEINKRLLYGNESMKRAAALAGIDYSQQARAKDVNTLVASIQSLAKEAEAIAVHRKLDKSGYRRAQLIGSGGTSIIDQMMSMITEKGYADLLLDVVSHTNGMDYYSSMSADIEKVKKMLMEPFLTFGQHNIYGSSQSYFRLGVRGVSNAPQYRDAISMAREGNPMAAYALPSLALTYGPTTNLRANGLIRSIADKSSINFGVGEGLSFFNTPTQVVGDVTSAEILSFLSVGSLVRREEIENYIKSVDPKANTQALLSKAFGDSQEMFSFTFDTVKKVAQVPQRLKNAVGARPLYDISENAQRVLEDPMSGEAATLGRDYVWKLREELKLHFRRQINIDLVTDEVTRAALEREMENKIDALVQPDMDIGAYFGGQIRRILSQPLAELVKRERDEIEQLLGTEVNTSTIGSELLRVRMLRADMYGSSYRGVIGGSRRHGAPVALVQLTGGYSDYFYANPMFGGSQGMRQGLLERAEKRVKASMLSTDWQEKTGVLIQPGYTIRLDKKTGTASVFDERGNWVRAIDSRDQMDAIEKVVENTDINGLPSFANVQATSSNRLGEDSVELILRFEQQSPASVDKYQMNFEATYVRSIKPGGGRRVEGNWAGALVKGVAVFTRHDNEYSFFGGILDQLNQMPTTTFGGQLDIRNVFGLLSPANLKSFVYGHGAELLTDNRKRTGLLNAYNDAAVTSGSAEAERVSKRLAAAILLGFGTSMIESSAEANAIKQNLYRAAAQGELGEYFQGVAAATGLLEFKDERGQVMDAASVFTSEASFKVAQTPLLAAITSEDIMQAINGSGGRLFDKLSTAITNAAKEAEGTGYMVAGDFRHQQAGILLTALDIFDQLSVQVDRKRGRNLVTLPTDFNVKNASVRAQLAAIVGMGLNDMEDETKVENILGSMLSKAPVLRLFMDLSFSHSKEPVSTKMTGKLEMQHLIKPLQMLAGEFADNKSLDKMRVTIANMFAAISHGSLYQYVAAGDLPSKNTIVDITDPFVRTPMFKQRMLGIYGTGLHTDKFEQLRKEYGQYTEELQVLIRDKTVSADRHEVKVIMTKLATVQGQLLELARYYQLFEDKPASVGISNAVVGAMNNPRFGFFVPYMEPIMSEHGVILKVDKTRGFYSFMPSGDDIRLMGAQFGNYIDRIVQATIVLQSGFAPGGPLDDMFTRMSKIRGSTHIAMSNEEWQHLDRFYKTALEMPALLADAASGTRLQRATGAAIPFRGGVSTPAASGLVPPEMVVLASETLAKHGLRVSETKWRMLEDTDAEMSRTHSTLQSLAYESMSQADKNIIENKRKFLTGQRFALTEGLSEQGTKGLLDRALKESRELAEDYSNAMTFTDLKERQRHLGKVFGRADRMARRFSTTVYDLNKRGDSFAQLAAISEMEIWKSQARISSLEAQNQVTPLSSKAAEILDAERNQLRMFKELPFYVTNFTLGSANSARKTMEVSHLALEGKLRGNIVRSIMSADITKEIFELDADHRTDFLDYKLTTLIDHLETANAKRDNPGPHVKESVRAMRSSRLGGEADYNNRLASRLVDIRDRVRRGGTKTADVLAEINAAYAMYDVSGVSSAIGFRSPPFGSTEPQLQILDVLRDIAVVNEYAQGIDGGSGRLIQYSGADERNASLTLLSPISILTMNLGDFDGDPYTFIFSELQGLEHKVMEKKDNIKMLQFRRSKWSKELSRLEPDTLDYEDLKTRVDNTEKQILKNEEEIPRIRLKIKEMDEHLQRDIIDKGVAHKQVAAYMGINAKYLLTESQGGYLADSDKLDANVLFTFIEQGRGLYPGIDDKYKSIDTLYKALDRLIEPTSMSGPMNLNMHLSSIEALKSRAAELAQDMSDNSGGVYERIINNNEVASAVFAELQNFVNTYEDSTSVEIEDYKSGLADQTVSMYYKMLGTNEFQKMMKRAGGTQMELSTYDMLTKVLGKAGGDILGKTYNSIVGTLFADSPMLAVGHVLTRSDEVSSGVEQYIDNLINTGKLSGDEWSTGADFIENIKTSMSNAEQLQGFMKDIQQLLRDSIKLKGGTNILSALRDKAQQYEDPNLDDAGRTRVLNDIVKDIGPGPGLKSLMRLDSFVNNINGSISDFELADEFGVSKLGDEYAYITGTLQAADLINESDPTKAYRTNKMVAAYKTVRDIQHMVTAFNFERGSSSKQFMDNFIRVEERRGQKDVILDKFRNRSNAEFGEYSRALASYNDDDLTPKPNDSYDDRLTAFEQKYGESGLLLFAHMYEQSKAGTRGVFGEFGQNLLAFAHKDSIRKTLTNVMEGRSETIAMPATMDQDIFTSDITLTLMNLASTNKLDPSAAALFYQSMEGLLKVGGIASDPKDVLMNILSSTTRNNNGNEAATKISAQIGALNMLEQEGSEFRLTFSQGGQEHTAIYSSLLDYLQQSLTETRAGLESKMIQSFVKTIINDGVSSGRKPKNAREFATYILKPKGSDSDTEPDEAMITKIVENIESMSEVDSIFKENVSTKPVLEGKYAEVARKSISRMASEDKANTMDLILPAFLSIMGQAIASGSVEPEAFQDVVGSTLVAAAYSRPNFGSRTATGFMANVGIGSAFKFRMAINEAGGDPGEGITRLIARELTFNAISAWAAPKLTNLMTQKLFGARPQTLDRDYHEGSRNVAGMMSGAVLSAALGVLGGNVASGVVGMMSTVPTANLVDTALDYIAVKARAIGAQTFLEESDAINIFNEEDGESVDAIYSDEPISFYGSNPQSLAEAVYTDNTMDTIVVEPVNLFEDYDS
jgi:hypothetical protein